MSEGKDDASQTDAVNVQQALTSAKAAPVSREEREQDRAAQDFSRTDNKSPLAMRVKIYSPFRDYYDGQALSLSAVNATGPFDILPKHHNFISLLSACELIIRGIGGHEQKIIISGGVMHVKADQVIVFLDV